MGPLSLNREKYDGFLNVVNYISMLLSYGILAVDASKSIFFPEQPLFKIK